MAYKWLENDPNLVTYTFQRIRQRYTLATLYFSTNGTAWFDSLDWLDDGDECLEWKQKDGDPLGCVNEEVVELDLSTNNLAGSLPPKIALLSNSLARLDLGENDIWRSIPSEVGFLTAFTSLDLSENRLTGTVPSFIHNMTNLDELWLYGNEFTGSLPCPAFISSCSISCVIGYACRSQALRTPSTPQNMAYEWLANNTNIDTYTDQRRIQRYALATLYFGTNGTTWFQNDNWLDDGDECGRWATRAGALTCSNDGEVIKLHLSLNNLRGRFPPEIALLTTMTRLELDRNILSGSIPTEVGGLTAVWSLDLHDNQLSGSVPSEIGLMTAMTSLDLWSNKLSGPLPTEIGNLTATRFLDLSENQLTGTIPPFLINLHELYLYDNEFTGSFTCPEFIFDCRISCDYYGEMCRSL